MVIGGGTDDKEEAGLKLLDVGRRDGSGSAGLKIDLELGICGFWDFWNFGILGILGFWVCWIFLNEPVSSLQSQVSSLNPQLATL